jgi:hypothetical protein
MFRARADTRAVETYPHYLHIISSLSLSVSSPRPRAAGADVQSAPLVCTHWQ